MTQPQSTLPNESPRALNAESVRAWLERRPGWTHEAGALTREFRLRSFRDSIVFVNRVATIADTLKRAPDIDVRGPVVCITIRTDETRGITEQDLELAEQIDFSTSMY